MDLKDLTPFVNQAAGATSRAYRTWVSFPDVAAHLWLFAVNSEDRLAEYMSRKEGPRIVAKILNQEARTYAIKERAAVSGYSPEDLTWYSLAQIRRILPDVFDYQDWQSFQTGSARGSKPVANATGDRLATILDVSVALTKLQEDQVNILSWYYREANSLEWIADQLDISEEAARKRLERALKALQNELGGPRPVDPYEAVNGQFDTRTKGRKAVSNTAARAATDNAWGGE